MQGSCQLIVQTALPAAHKHGTKFLGYAGLMSAQIVQITYATAHKHEVIFFGYGYAGLTRQQIKHG